MRGREPALAEPEENCDAGIVVDRGGNLSEGEALEAVEPQR